MLENFMKDDFFLWFVVTAKPFDNSGHPFAVVAVSYHAHAVVHDLHGPIPERNDFA